MLTIFLIIFSICYCGLIIWSLGQKPSGVSGLQEFFVAGRDVGFWRGLATIGATEIGLITIAYNAQKGFNEGFSAFHIGIAALIGCLFVGLTGFVVTAIRRTDVLTIPEYYEVRYGRDIRILGAIIMALGGILNMGLFLKVASLVLVALLGLQDNPMSANMLMIVLIVIAVAYTCYGGMRSVIATDVFQFILLTTGLLIATLYLTNLIPVEQAVSIIREQKGASGFNPLVNPNFGPVYVLWMILVAGVVSAAIWPTALSRALCIEDEETVQRIYLASSIIFMARMIVPAFIGLLAFCYFALPENSQQAGQLQIFGADRDLAATAFMLGKVLPDWLIALVAVAFFASFMSTQDGYLFCWGSIIARDIAGPLTGRTDDEAFQKKITRWAIVLVAVYELYWGLIYQGGEDIWDYLAVSGSIYFCSGIVILAGGLYWKKATRRGALYALIIGFSSIIALEPVKMAIGLEDVSGPAIGFMTIGLSLLGFVLGSISDPNAEPPS